MATKSKFTVKHGLAVNTQSGSTTTLNYPTADGTAGQFIKTDGSGNFSFDSASSSFLGLTDTPASYSGHGNSLVKVDSAGTAVVFTNVYSSQGRETFTANGTQTSYTLSNTYSSINSLLVFVDGVVQFPATNFSLDSTVLTFTSAPDSDARIEIFGNSNSIVQTPGDGTVTGSKLDNPLNLTNNVIKFNDVDSDVPSTNTLIFGTDNDFKIGYQGSGSGHLPDDLVIDQSDDQAIVMRRITHSNNGPDLKFFLDTPSPAGGDNLGDIVWAGRSGSGGFKHYYGMRGISRSVGSGSEKGALEFYGEDGISYPSLILDDQSTNKGVRIQRGIYPYNKLRLEEDVVLTFEGASNNSYETTLTVEDPTQDRTITLPDSTGTVMLNVVDDLNPQLGGDLEGNSKNLLNLGNITADSATFTDNIRVDGGNLIIGDDAYSTSSAFVGMKTSNQSGANDYMILSGTSDGSTYVSAKTGSTVKIRSGGNNNTAQLEIQATKARFSGPVEFNNQSISQIHALAFNDPGPNEGLSWSGGNMKVYESPNNLVTNSAGNLQVVHGSTRRFTVSDSGAEVIGNLKVDSSVTIDAGSKTGAGLSITGTNTGQSNFGPNIFLNRDPSDNSRSDWDYLGALYFRGENSAGNMTSYSTIVGRIAETQSGNETGRTEIYGMLDGSWTRSYVLAPNSLMLTTEQTIRWIDHKGTSYETYLDWDSPTAERTITLPDATGTVVLLDATQTLTNKSIVATQLTGTIDSARFPAALPAVSGANLTNLPEAGDGGIAMAIALG